ncbi:MAG TPA: XdhC family protein [Thermoanaerobaculia bacterium]|jgi:xanthine/CO dehydrogenase XdhC/CoxF family maturation factor
MRDVLSEIERWRADDEEVAVATVVKTWGSAPRSVGARMGMASSGKIAGSVSGGCVEGAVAEEATRILATGKPKLLIFGVEDEKAWTVGLACGGTIEVFVEKLQDAAFERFERRFPRKYAVFPRVRIPASRPTKNQQNPIHQKLTLAVSNV